jgi:hypothetical protein
MTGGRAFLTGEGRVNTILSRHLDSVGDGSGVKNFNGDYSIATGSPEIGFIQPPTGEIYRIARMIIIIEDTTGFQQQEYGNLGVPLSEGVGLQISDDSGVILDLLDGVKVLTNGMWGHFNYDVDVKSWGSGDEQLLARWSFDKSGAPIRLVGDDNERLEVTFDDDDLQGLTGHYFLVQGLKEFTK